MAVALRPAVLLIIIASLLFFSAGVLDTTSGVIDASAIESWVFGAINLVVAVFIARGNERMLALRIGLAAFFMVERPVTAVAFGPKPIEGIALHMATAIVEAFILISTLRVWRLGHSVSQADLAFLALPLGGAPPAAAGASAASGRSVAVAPVSSPGTWARAGAARFARVAAQGLAKVAALARRARWRRRSHR